MTDDTHNSIFRQGARRPRSVPFRGKPVMRPVVLHVSGVNQSNQNVHIQQKPDHGSSSRSRCTNSEVTRGAPFRIFRSGTPFRFLRALSEGERARLASEEITSPTDFFSFRAISLAALSTSSSIARVVRIRHHASYIKHHASDAYDSTFSACCTILPFCDLSIEIAQSPNRPITQ